MWKPHVHVGRDRLADGCTKDIVNDYCEQNSSTCKVMIEASTIDLDPKKHQYDALTSFIVI
jgi:hypothetical protein